ncbi:MAG TPA: putative toxin-antitoxin system toxin component, PIN family [Solirubrobacterales bacterium]|nr:putative toxin-antitoxin system toxin component, PIN family [Solirubrobacterales bacterium]
MKRFVIDPSTLVSGIAGIQGESPPALLIRALQAMRFEIVVCPEILSEVSKALRKPYFRDRVPAAEARRAVMRIREVAILSEDPPAIEPTLRDPNDDYLLALARQVGAEAIVTGDKDLLDHHEDLRPPAITAREACELLGAGG